MNFFENTYNLVSFIITVFGFILAVYAIWPKSKKDRIALIHGDFIKLFHDLTRNFPSLKIKHQTSEIDNENELLYYSIYFQNIGENDIKKEDVQQNITLEFNDSIDILDYHITSDPKEINPRIHKEVNNILLIDFDLLKQNEIIKIDFIFKSEMEPIRDFSKSYLKIKPISRIFNFIIEEKIIDRKPIAKLIEEMIMGFLFFFTLFALTFFVVGKNGLNPKHNQDWYLIEKKDSLNITNKQIFKAEISFRNTDTILLHDLVKKKDTIFSTKELLESYTIKYHKRRFYYQTFEFWLIFGSLYILFPLSIIYIQYSKLKRKLALQKRIKYFDKTISV